MVIKNAIKCKKCGEVIESVSLHDFKICPCGACAVDGGHEYLRRSAPSLNVFIDLSVVKLDESDDKLFFIMVQQVAALPRPAVLYSS